MSTTFAPKSRRKFWHAMHRSFNDAVLKLHDPIAETDAKEAQHRAGVIEDAVAMLTMLGFTIKYPDGFTTLRDLAASRESPRVESRPVTANRFLGLSMFPVAVGQSPHARPSASRLCHPADNVSTSISSQGESPSSEIT